MEEENNVFSIRLTRIVKGAAIILMIVHHLFNNNAGLQVEVSLNNIEKLIGSSAKVCVCLFTILSGYGLTISWNKKENHKYFVRNHIIKLWLSFVFIYFFCVIIRILEGKGIVNIYGGGVTGIFYALKDMLGLQNFIIQTPTINGVWWYMEAIFICYLMFPLLHKITSKNKKISIVLLGILYLPWIVYYIYKGWNWHTDREIFYLFSFELGIFCAQYKIFNKLVKFSKEKTWISIIVSIIILIIMFFIRSKFALVVDSFWAISIIGLSICILSRIPILSNILYELGIYSSDIYLFHSIIITSMKSIRFSEKIYRLIAVIFICWAIAILIKKLQTILKYDLLIKKSIKEG